jgi:hypothetical protein
MGGSFLLFWLRFVLATSSFARFGAASLLNCAKHPYVIDSLAALVREQQTCKLSGVNPQICKPSSPM